MPSFAEPSWTLLVHAGFLLTNAIVNAHVGDRVLASEAASRDSHLARRMFATWWYAIALAGILTATSGFLSAVGLLVVPIHVALVLCALLATSTALCGLVYYLVFLFLGTRRILAPLLVGYAAFFTLAVYYVTSGQPVGVDVQRWSARLAYASPLPQAFRAAMFAFLVLPPVLGSLAYASLLLRTREPGPRYRITLVSMGVSAWSLSVLLQGTSVFPESDAFQVGVRLLALAGILLVLAAYRPPGFARRRWMDDAAMGRMPPRA